MGGTSNCPAGRERGAYSYYHDGDDDHEHPDGDHDGGCVAADDATTCCYTHGSAIPGREPVQNGAVMIQS
eukprot:COSAG01_NODE_62164_length_286_cov_0.556150_1_plen_69_part_10